MERLTETGKVFTFPKTDPAENTYLERVQKRLAAYEDTGLTPEQINGLCEMDRRAKMAYLLRLEEYQALGTVDELAALAKARDEGRVVPCKVGDAIFVITDTFNGENIVQTIEARKIDRIGGNELNPIWVVSTEPYELHFFPSEFRKTVFLTRAEAEAAIGGGGDGMRSSPPHPPPKIQLHFNVRPRAKEEPNEQN